DLGVTTQRRLLELIVERFGLGDLNRSAETFVVRTKAHEATDYGFVGAVPFAGARERAVELDTRALGCATDKAARQQTEAARAGGVGGAGADHDGANDI